MPDRRPDRRVRRTRRRLKTALLELIEERDYDAITIRELAERADVGRSTFYSHYDSKEDLLFEGFEAWLVSFGHAAGGGGEPASCEDHEDELRPFRFSLPLLRHIRAQERFFRATVLGGADARLRRKITNLLARVVARELEGGTGTTPAGGPEGSASAFDERERGADAPGVADLDGKTLREARAQGVAGAFLGTASWWVAHRPALPPEAVDILFQRVVHGPLVGA